jgi:hypothetical protein
LCLPMLEWFSGHWNRVLARNKKKLRLTEFGRKLLNIYNIAIFWLTYIEKLRPQGNWENRV